MILSSLLLHLFVLLPPIPSKLTPELVEILNNASYDEKIFVIVHMNTEYPYEEFENLNPREKCRIFEEVAKNSQRAVINFLKRLPVEKAEVLKEFWIYNGFHLKATKDVIYELAKRNDIWFICYNATIDLDVVIAEEYDSRTPEWNIIKIMADSCWAHGYNGDGVIIGHISTGCNVSHPALIGKWLSPYWVDPVYGNSAPYDDLGMGIHAIGVICGGDGSGPFADDIEIAYGARFIPTKCTNSSGLTNYAWSDSCMQYLANLKQRGVDIRVISNCWGSANGSDLHWWGITVNWKNLGILPVFPVGG